MAYAGEVFAQLLTVQAYAQEEGELRRYSRLLGEADSKQQAVTIFHKGWTAGFHLLTKETLHLGSPQGPQVAVCILLYLRGLCLRLSLLLRASPWLTRSCRRKQRRRTVEEGR